MASSEKTQIGKDTKKIDDTFGKSNQIVLIVPADDPVGGDLHRVNLVCLCFANVLRTFATKTSGCRQQLLW